MGFAGQSIASRPERFRREAVTSRSVAAHGYKLMAYKDEDEFEATIVEVARDLAQANSDLALLIAALPGKIRGYDQIKADRPDAAGIESEALITASREGCDAE